MANLNLPEDSPSFQLPEQNTSDSTAPLLPLDSGNASSNGDLYSFATNGTTTHVSETLITKQSTTLMEYAS